MERSIETPRLLTRSLLWPLLMALLAAAGLCAVVQPGLAAEPQATPTLEFAVLDGEPITLAELAQGRWVLGFVILPGCPACEGVITRFGLAGQAFPRVNFLLVTLAATPEFISFVNEHAEGMQVLLDSDGSLGASLGVTRAPTIIFLMEGAQFDQLSWPFTEGDLHLATAELDEFPDTARLVGQPSPEFTALDLTGSEGALTYLLHPLLLAFFNPDCPPCRDVLPALVKTSTEVLVVILVVVGEEGLSDEHRTRFEKSGAGAGQIVVLLLKDFQVVEAYQVTVTPTTILIDEQGSDNRGDKWACRRARSA